jgi:hypothetical protein
VDKAFFRRLQNLLPDMCLAASRTMTDTTNQNGSILILTLVTIGLSIYTFVGTRWWFGNRDKLPKRLVGVLTLVAIAAIFFVPPLLLSYLTSEMKLAKKLGPYGGGIVLLVWCVPGAIYSLIHAFRRNKPKD